MTQYSIRKTVDDDFLLICGKVPQDFTIKKWTVLCDGEVACVATLIKVEELCILNSDFNSNMTHSAISVFRISCYIVEEALKYAKDIIAYGDVKPSKYLQKLGFNFLRVHEDVPVGIYVYGRV